MEKAEVERLIKTAMKKNPKKLFPIKSLQDLGLSRYICKSCGKNFWSASEKEFCGDVSCIGRYTFLDNRLTPLKASNRQIWERFAKMFEKFGHTEIKRYPVVARWRNDLYFVEAAIDDFAPYVIKGIAEPPANPLVVPQICLRFNDINNVGLSGRHLTSFIMAEQAAFNTNKKKTYFDKEAIKYIFKWLTDGLQINKNYLTFVEDAWVGAGYAGNSLEFFAGGLELGNQVYMRYFVERGQLKDLKAKTIDMGAGLNRWAWLSQGTPTVYEAVFPRALDLIKKKIGFDYEEKLLKKAYEFLGRFDFEEKHLSAAINAISKETGLDYNQTREMVEKMQAVYSVADHTRTLLISIHDGALPSNVGGGYNLRNILRRALLMIAKNDWDLDLNEVIDVHKKEFGSWFTELNDFDISKIIDKEKERFKEFGKRNSKLISSIIKNGKVEESEMKRLYQSNGITIDDIRYQSEIEGKTVSLPEKFYTDINKTIVDTEQSEDKDIKGVKETQKLFYKEELSTTSAKIIKKIKPNIIVLDKTIFYPEMGGQKPDGGTIDGIDVSDVRIKDNVIIHYLKEKIKKGIGNKVSLSIDLNRRERLRKHHTATHIVNRAARIVLGDFVYQNGAEKDVDSAHLDITYYDKLSREQINSIEKLANKIVSKNLKMTVKIMERTAAEMKYGMSIYQGGAIPSATLRIVEIEGYDVEACGGLHCHTTGELNFIKIIKAERIQDGVVRLTFMADKPALEQVQKIDKIVKDLMELWGVQQDEIYKTAERFFSESKRFRELYEKSEVGRISATALSSYSDPIEINTKIDSVGAIINGIESVRGQLKDKNLIINGEKFGLAFPKNDTNKNKLMKNYKEVIEKGDFLLGH
jgi:alanyl-tRNA synthetase